MTVQMGREPGKHSLSDSLSPKTCHASDIQLDCRMCMEPTEEQRGWSSFPRWKAVTNIINRKCYNAELKGDEENEKVSHG